VKPLVLATLLAFPALTFAQATAFDECFTGAATRYTINKSLLVAIARTESQMNPNAQSPKNKDGSYDIGLMQVNSTWLPTLKQYGLSKADLLSACTNIYVGAWIMANNISRHGATWNAVGAYNATTMSKREIYVAKVRKNFQESPAEPVVPPPVKKAVVIRVASN
jgi:soluble lytic murein transglycosylase-like protein